MSFASLRRHSSNPTHFPFDLRASLSRATPPLLWDPEATSKTCSLRPCALSFSPTGPSDSEMTGMGRRCQPRYSPPPAVLCAFRARSPTTAETETGRKGRSAPSGRLEMAPEKPKQFLFEFFIIIQQKCAHSFFMHPPFGPFGVSRRCKGAEKTQQRPHRNVGASSSERTLTHHSLRETPVLFASTGLFPRA